MLCRKLKCRAVRPAKDHWHGKLSARHVEHLRGSIHDLIDSKESEIPRHELDDRAQSYHRRTNANTREAELGDRRVDNSHRAEFVEQSLGDFVSAIVLRYFLTHKEHTIVSGQLLAERLRERVPVRHDCHCQLVVSTRTSFHRSFTGGSGLASAKSQASCAIA